MLELVLDASAGAGARGSYLGRSAAHSASRRAASVACPQSRPVVAGARAASVTGNGTMAEKRFGDTEVR